MIRKVNYKPAFIIMLVCSIVLICAALILRSQLNKKPSSPSSSPTPQAGASASASALESTTATAISTGTYSDSENKFSFQIAEGYAEVKEIEDFINPVNEAKQIVIAEATKNEIDEFIKNGDKTALFLPSKVLYVYVTKVDDQVTETLMKNSKSNAPITTKNNLSSTKFVGLTNSGYTFDQVVIDIGLGQNKMLVINNYYQGDKSAQETLDLLLSSLKKT